MKIRHIGLIMLLVAVMALALVACGAAPAGTTAGTDAPPATQPAAKTYTVSFGGLAPAQTVEEGKLANNPGEAEKDYHSFVAWQLNGVDYDFSTPVTADIALEAKFAPLSYPITYVVGEGVNHEDNPTSYTYGDEITFLAPEAPDGMTFVKWDIAGVTPTTHGALTVTAVYEEALNIFVQLGFEGQYPHYAELAWTAPNGDAQTKSASPAANWYIQEVYALDLTHGKTPTIAEGFKNAKNLTTVEYEGTNAYLSVQLGSEKPSGYVTVTANEDYNVGVLLYLGGKVLSEDVRISIDVRMTAEGAFPINFYLRSQNNKFHGSQDRICLLNMDGQGNLTVGYDDVNAARVAYVDASGATLTQSEILATASIGDWHTISFELR